MWEALMCEAFDVIAKACDKDALLSGLPLEPGQTLPDEDAS
jgi:hypothetical protein